MADNKELRVAGKCQQAQEKFRIMIFRLSRRLKNSECVSILFLADLPTPEHCASASEGFSLHVLSSLEANGRISPWNVEFLEFLLTEIHHEELLQIVRDYKDSKEYKKAWKEIKKGKKSKEREGDSEACTCPGEKAVGGLGKTLDSKRRLRNLYAILINHITGLTQVMEMLRDELDNDSAMERFLQVAENGEQFTDDLHKVFRDMGIKSNRSSMSSDMGIKSNRSSMSSDMGIQSNRSNRSSTSSDETPADRHDGDTEMMKQLIVSSPLLVEHQKQSPTASTRVPRKKPVPLPRTKYAKATLQEHDEPQIYENLGPIKQEEGGDVSLTEYRKYLQSVSAMTTLSSRDTLVNGEEEEDEEDTAGDTGDSGIAEWTSGRRVHSDNNLLGSTPPEKDGCAKSLDLDRVHSEGDLLDSCTNKAPVYTSLRGKDPVSEYSSVSYGDDMQRS